MRPVDYRKFRLKYLNTPEFSHVKLLLFWPVFGLLFAFVERVGVSNVYTPIHIPLDDHIPFCEWFVIPYLFWFVFLIGMLVYTFFFEVPAFRKMMRFVICTYSVTMAIYIHFPNCQNLRPTAFPRDNILTRFMAWFYALIGLKMISDGVLRGAGDMTMFTVDNLVNLGLRVVLAVTLAPRFGIQFVWMAVPMGWLVNYLISFFQYRTGKWAKLHKASSQ